MTSCKLYVDAWATLIATACLVSECNRVDSSSNSTHAAGVVVASYGGAFEDAQTMALFQQYAKATGVRVIRTAGTSCAKVKAMVESHNVTWDVIAADGAAFANEGKTASISKPAATLVCA